MIKLKHFLKFGGSKGITLKNVKMFLDDCRNYSGDGYLTLHKTTERKKKSNEQNRYYWGVVIPLISEAIGNLDDPDKGLVDYKGVSAQETHAILGQKFLMIKKGGLEYVKSTSLDTWTTVDWENYMSKVRSWASAFLGVYIPLPNETEF